MQRTWRLGAWRHKYDISVEPAQRVRLGSFRTFRATSVRVCFTPNKRGQRLHRKRLKPHRRVNIARQIRQRAHVTALRALHIPPQHIRRRVRAEPDNDRHQGERYPMPALVIGADKAHPWRALAKLCKGRDGARRIATCSHPQVCCASLWLAMRRCTNHRPKAAQTHQKWFGLYSANCCRSVR